MESMIQCDHQIEHRKPDIVLIEKESKQCWIIDIACPADNKVCDKESMKKDRYERLAFELKQLLNHEIPGWPPEGASLSHGREVVFSFGWQPFY